MSSGTGSVHNPAHTSPDGCRVSAWLQRRWNLARARTAEATVGKHAEARFGCRGGAGDHRLKAVAGSSRPSVLKHAGTSMTRPAATMVVRKQRIPRRRVTARRPTLLRENPPLLGLPQRRSTTRPPTKYPPVGCTPHPPALLNRPRARRANTHSAIRLPPAPAHRHDPGPSIPRPMPPTRRRHRPVPERAAPTPTPRDPASAGQRASARFTQGFLPPPSGGGSGGQPNPHASTLQRACPAGFSQSHPTPRPPPQSGLRGECFPRRAISHLRGAPPREARAHTPTTTENPAT